MKYLLDTHVLLWYFADSPRLTETAAAVIEDIDAQKFVSIASLWEFTIKHCLEKLQFEGGISAFWNMITANGITILPITEMYLRSLSLLPFFHRDPFDRLLIATAVTENMTLLTADEHIHKYDVSTLW